MKEKIIELRENGFSYNKISEELGCSKSTVSYHCSKLSSNEEKIKENVKIKNEKQKVDKSFLIQNVDVDAIISLRKNRYSYSEIKDETGISVNSIKKVCREFGLLNIRKVYKLCDEEIDRIKTLYDEHKSLRKVSKLTGYDRTTISKYVDVVVRKKKITKSQAVINWRRKAKIKLVEYKGGECEKCGYNKCVDALEFHHKDPNEKDFSISGKSWAFERLKKEVDKCMLVCSNCHKEIHYELKQILASTEAS